MKKNESGITLISLAITIIVLIILSSVGVISGVNTIKLARYNKFIEEIKMVQLKVNELYDSYKNGETVTLKNGTEYSGTDILNIGTDLSSISAGQLNEIFSVVGSGITDRNGYKYYNTSTIESLDLEGIEHEFLVNVETRSVISTEPLIYEGTAYYTLAQLPDGEGLYNVQYENTEDTLTFDVTSEAQGGKGKIHITNINYQYVNKWQVRYRLQAESGQPENPWTTTEEFTGDSIDIDVDKWGIYEVQVVHGDEIQSEIKIIHVGLSVGDYVDYTYDTVSGGYNLESRYSGYTSNQTITQPSEALKWRVFKVNEDGSADLISETPTSQRVYLKGALGYNNGVLLLNDMCEILFSNSSLGTNARSINIKDIEDKMNATGIATRNGYTSDNGVAYGNTQTYGIDYDQYPNNQYPNLYEKEYGSGINTTTIKTDGIDVNADGYSNPTTETSSTANSGLTATQTYYILYNAMTYFDNSEVYNMLFETGGDYFLASRFANCHANIVNFGLLNTWESGLYGESLFSSSGVETSNSRHLRPIVSLRKDIHITTDEGDADENNMHQIN